MPDIDGISLNTSRAIQAYMIFQLNDRLKQLSGPENQAGSPQIKIPKLPNLTFPKLGQDDELFKDHAWNPL